jgi:hypothetical protein
MLIASWPLQDFAGFLQIISWITLPVLLIAVLSTIILHYYQRRKRQPVPENERTAFTGKPGQPPPDLYAPNENELTQLQSELKRQDWVIDQLRADVTSLEKTLDTMRLALQFKEEQLLDLKQFMEDKKTSFQPALRPANIAAEIS